MTEIAVGHGRLTDVSDLLDLMRNRVQAFFANLAGVKVVDLGVKTNGADNYYAGMVDADDRIEGRNPSPVRTPYENAVLRHHTSSAGGHPRNFEKSARAMFV